MQLRKFTVLALVVAVAALSFGVLQAASNATMTFLDTYDQPEVQITASDLIDEIGGCDYVTIVMTDANGLITDIDSLCIDTTTGDTIAYTDWWSYNGATGAPELGPITYSLFDTEYNDVCYNDENSVSCADLIASGVAACIGEAYYQPPSLPAGTAYAHPLCGGSSAPGIASEGCRLVVPTGSVVADAPFNAQVYYAPGQVSPGVVLNPGTYIVIGQDESESYYKIMLACAFVWVDKDALQPSYAAPQNGAPLPTRVVS